MQWPRRDAVFPESLLEVIVPVILPADGTTEVYLGGAKLYMVTRWEEAHDSGHMRLIAKAKTWLAEHI